MRIPNKSHQKHPWRVLAIATDYELEDVWEFPLSITDPENGLQRFRLAFERGMDRIAQKGLPALLFQFRMWLGKVMDWDQVPKTKTAYELGKRWQAKGNTLPPQKPMTTAGFQEVYCFENESLAEISNSTIDAALHLALVPQDDGRAKIHLAVFVRKKGALSALYMALIRPFRHWIVYPKMMKTMAEEWHQLDSEPKPSTQA